MKVTIELDLDFTDIGDLGPDYIHDYVDDLTYHMRHDERTLTIGIHYDPTES